MVTRDIQLIKRFEDTTEATEATETVGEEPASAIDLDSDSDSDEDTPSPKKNKPAPVIPMLASTRSCRETAGKYSSTRYQQEAFVAHARSLDPDEPPSYTEAISSPLAEQWNAAIQEELKSVIDNQTWELVELPKGRTPVKCRWTFRVKRGAGGDVIRYKARLVAKGFTQRYGIDYLETFAPVVKLTSLCIILALATARDYEVDQTDIKSAYLLAKLNEVFYMDIPEGLTVENSGQKVFKLLKGLYGLQQSGRMLNQEWDRHLVGTGGVTRSQDDHAVYLKKNNESDDYWWVLIWVDDVLWIGPRAMVDQVKAQLAKQFPVTDLGRAHFFSE